MGRPFKRSGRIKSCVWLETDTKQAALDRAMAQGKSLSEVVNEALALFFSVGNEKIRKKDH